MASYKIPVVIFRVQSQEGFLSIAGCGPQVNHQRERIKPSLSPGHLVFFPLGLSSGQVEFLQVAEAQS